MERLKRRIDAERHAAEQQVSDHERLIAERAREALRSKKVQATAVGADMGIAKDHGANGAVPSPTAPSSTPNGTSTNRPPASLV